MHLGLHLERRTTEPPPLNIQVSLVSDAMQLYYWGLIMLYYYIVLFTKWVTVLPRRLQ
jgi:hypothetical protein